MGEYEFPSEMINFLCVPFDYTFQGVSIQGPQWRKTGKERMASDIDTQGQLATLRRL